MNLSGRYLCSSVCWRFEGLGLWLDETCFYVATLDAPQLFQPETHFRYAENTEPQ